MERRLQGGVARIIAAGICAAAALTGATTPASAAEGPVPLTVGGVPADPAAAAAAAAAIVDAATQAAGAPASPVAADSEPATEGQYQPPDGQYQGGNGQYQGLPAPVETTQVPDTTTPAAPAALPTNINVSVRVLSPGDDGAVNQSSQGAAQPVTSTDGTAVAVSAGPTQVTISVSVNITNNWPVVSNLPSSSGWYQTPDTQYQTPANTTPENDTPAAPSSSPSAPPAPPAPLPADPVERTAAPIRARAAAAPVSRRERGTRGRERARAVVARPFVAAAVVAVARAPLPPQPPAQSAVKAPARTESAPATVRVPDRPRFPRPSGPEQLGSAAASGAFGAGTVFQSLAILVASLLLAWLASAGRLGASVQPPGDPPAKRRRKPG